MIFLSSYTMGTDTQNIKDAITAAKNSGEEQILVLEDRKAYTITETIDVSGLIILGNDSKLIFDFASTETVGLIAEGSVGTHRNIDTTAVKRTYYIHSSAISADSLVTGDLVLVSADTIGGEGIKVGEIKRVNKYASNKVYLNDYLFETYELGMGSNAKVAKVSPVKLKIYNLEIEYANPDSTSSDTAGIQVKYGDNVVISGVKFNNAKAAAIRLYSCYNPLVDNCEVDNSNLTGEGHGVLLGNACMYATVRDSKFVGIRHAVITGGATADPGMQWEASIHNVSGTITTPDSEKVFVAGGTVGSMTFTDCTAIGGWDIDSYVDWDKDVSYNMGVIVADQDEHGIYKLYKALINGTAVDRDPYYNTGEWVVFDPADYKYGGIEIRGKGDIVIQDFRAIGLKYGLKLYRGAGTQVNKLNLVIKDMYAEEVAYPVLIGEAGTSSDLDLLTIDGLVSTSYKDSYDHQYPAVMIQNTSINKWQFNNIKCFNKRLMVIDDIDAVTQSLPQELVINNASVTYSTALSVAAPSKYLLGLSEVALDVYPIKTIVFNNLKTDGSKLFHVQDVTEIDNSGLFFVFNNCTFTNVPSSTYGFKNDISIEGLIFNGCVYETNGSSFVELNQSASYLGLSGNAFLGSQVSSLINNPSSYLGVLYHTGNVLNGNTLINNPPSAPNNKEYGDT